MPILGLTDQAAAFPRIGELRKGGEKTEKRPGKDLEYFRFTTKDPEVMAAFRDAYGDKPREIDVFLPYPTTDENFETWMEEWAGGGLVHRCNGRYTVRYLDRQSGHYVDPAPGSMECPYCNGQRERTRQNPGCKEVGRLKVIVPALGRFAYVVALTTSVNDLAEISANLRAFEALRGSLVGIPFIFSRVPRMVSTPGQDGKRVRREKWMWHLEVAPQWGQAQIGAMRRAALPTTAPLAIGPGDGRYLEAGEDAAPLEEEDLGGPVVIEQPQNGHTNGRNGNGHATNGHAKPQTPQNGPVTTKGTNGRVIDQETGEILTEREYQGNRIIDLPQVLGRLRKMAGNGKAKPSGKAIAALHLTFEELFEDPEDYRLVLNEVFDVSGKSDLTNQQVKALLNWLKPVGDAIDNLSREEALAILALAKSSANETAVEAPAAPQVSPGKIADLRATIDGADGPVKAGFVADRLAMTGLYGDSHAAFSVMKEWPDMPEDRTLEFSTSLTVETALKIFDWAVDSVKAAA